MFGNAPPEVGCIDGSIESLCSGAVAGACYGFVFREPRSPDISLLKSISIHARSMARIGAIAGCWCFYGSCSSCVLSRGGCSDVVSAVGSGFFAGSAISMQLRLPPQMLVFVTLGSIVLTCTATAAAATAQPAAQAQSPPSKSFLSQPPPRKWLQQQQWNCVGNSRIAKAP